MKFVCFILRNMIIEHLVINDPMFKYEISQCNIKKMKEDYVLTTSGPSRYYELTFIKGFLNRYKRKNLLSNQETNDLISIVKNK